MVLHPNTSYGRLALSIRQQILSGELTPGDRLPTEPELSTTYQVSRNTAREALRILASQGLVTTKRGMTGGTFVAHPTTGHVSSSLETGLSLLAAAAALPLPMIAEVRELLEVPAAGLAAIRRTDEELAVLRRCVIEPESLDDASLFEHHRRFHIIVLRAAHNPVLELVTEPLFSVLQDRVFRESVAPLVWRQVSEQHRGILEHLEAGDEAGARAAMQSHLRRTNEIYRCVEMTFDGGGSGAESGRQRG